MIKQTIKRVIPSAVFLHHTPAITSLLFMIIGIAIAFNSDSFKCSRALCALVFVISIAIHRYIKVQFIIVGFLAFSCYKYEFDSSIQTARTLASETCHLTFHSSPRYTMKNGSMQTATLLYKNNTIAVDIEIDQPILPGEKVEIIGSFALFDYKSTPWSKSSAQKAFVRGVHGIFIIDSIVHRIPEERLLLSLSEKFETITNQYPSEIGPLLKALFRADQSEIKPGIKELFRRSGISHLLAMSGQHVATIVAILILILKPLPIPHALRATLTILIPWTLLLFTGTASSIVRSLLMSSILISAFFVRRKVSALNTLGVAAITILAVSPTQLFSPGFQLSFIAVGAILLTVAGLDTLSLKKIHKTIALLIIIPISAGIATTPITAAFFGTTVPIGIIANIILTPLFSILFVITIPLIIAGTQFDWARASINYLFEKYYTLTEHLIVAFNQPLTEMAHLTAPMIIIPCFFILLFATAREYKKVVFLYGTLAIISINFARKPIRHFEWKNESCSIKRSEAVDIIAIYDHKMITTDFLRWMSKESNNRTLVISLGATQNRYYLYMVLEKTQYTMVYSIENPPSKEPLPSEAIAISSRDTVEIDNNVIFPF